MSDYEYQIYRLTNAKRYELGLANLIWSDTLASVARAHSLDLATSGIFSHTGSDGATPEQRVHRITFTGENISAGRNKPEDAIADWMASSGHRVNILDDSSVYIGVGAVYVAHSRFRIYVTQVFGM